MFRTLDAAVMVSPQITPEQVGEAAGMGVTLIVNNRPDDEDAGQPSGAEIEAAARAAGMDYRAIPVTHSGFSGPQVDAMAAALEGAGGPVLAYCRSGTRSTLLWALARTKLGDDVAQLHTKANGAGYDLTPIEQLMGMLGANR